jgi:hypothetical protein
MQANTPSPGLKHYRTFLRIAIGGPIVVALLIIGVLLIAHKSSGGFATGEQLSEPPARRPAQYNQVCEQLGPLVVYITHGSPACFNSDTHLGNYAASVPGTIYSVPCETPSGADRRYVYISTAENCPNTTFPVTQNSDQTQPNTAAPVYSD